MINEFKIDGLVYDDIREVLEKKRLTILISNDDRGTILSINDGHIQFTMSAEKIAEYLK